MLTSFDIQYHLSSFRHVSADVGNGTRALALKGYSKLIFAFSIIHICFFIRWIQACVFVCFFNVFIFYSLDVK